MSNFSIRQMRSGDAQAVLAVYGEGIASGHATFQQDLPSWQVWDEGHLREARLIACDGERMLGWAALSPVSGRCVYAGVAEVSVYVAQKGRGRGIGKALLRALVEASEKAGYWTLQAGIFPENEASLALHKACGFSEVGRREALGKMSYGPMKDVWRDVIMLERRSQVVGRD